MVSTHTKESTEARLAKVKADANKPKKSKFGTPSIVPPANPPTGSPPLAPNKPEDQKVAGAEDQKNAPTGDKKKRKASNTVTNWKAQKAFPLDAKIHIVSTSNPKRRAAATRFNLYTEGMTVGQYIEASHKAGNSKALAMADVRWDHVSEFIKVG
jgi:hypothetical protein